MTAHSPPPADECPAAGSAIERSGLPSCSLADAAHLLNSASESHSSSPLSGHSMAAEAAANKGCKEDSGATIRAIGDTEPVAMPQKEQVSAPLKAQRDGLCTAFRAGQDSERGEDEMPSGCWGVEIAGPNGHGCNPNFVANGKHFKDKFCTVCQAHGLSVPVSRVRVLPDFLYDDFVNSNGGGVWTRLPACLEPAARSRAAGGEPTTFRLVNQTLKCEGPRLLVFRDDAPHIPGLTPPPSEWVTMQGTVLFVLSRGTLSPPRRQMPMMRKGPPSFDNGPNPSIVKGRVQAAVKPSVNSNVRHKANRLLNTIAKAHALPYGYNGGQTASGPASLRAGRAGVTYPSGMGIAQPQDGGGSRPVPMVSVMPPQMHMPAMSSPHYRQAVAMSGSAAPPPCPASPANDPSGRNLGYVQMMPVMSMVPVVRDMSSGEFLAVGSPTGMGQTSELANPPVHIMGNQAAPTSMGPPVMMRAARPPQVQLLSHASQALRGRGAAPHSPTTPATPAAPSAAGQSVSPQMLPLSRGHAVAQLQLVGMQSSHSTLAGWQLERAAHTSPGGGSDDSLQLSERTASTESQPSSESAHADHYRSDSMDALMQAVAAARPVAPLEQGGSHYVDEDMDGDFSSSGYGGQSTELRQPTRRPPALTLRAH